MTFNRAAAVAAIYLASFSTPWASNQSLTAYDGAKVPYQINLSIPDEYIAADFPRLAGWLQLLVRAPEMTPWSRFQLSHFFSYLFETEFAKREARENAIRVDIHPAWNAATRKRFDAEKAFRLQKLGPERYLLAAAPYLNELDVYLETLDSEGKPARFPSWNLYLEPLDSADDLYFRCYPQVTTLCTGIFHLRPNLRVEFMLRWPDMPNWRQRYVSLRERLESFVPIVK